VVTSSSCGKNYFLQNKPPAASGHVELVRKKLLFAKQTAGGQWSRRARAEKKPAVKPSPR
jgi:transposase-like protein